MKTGAERKLVGVRSWIPTRPFPGTWSVAVEKAYLEMGYQYSGKVRGAASTRNGAPSTQSVLGGEGRAQPLRV